MSQKKVLLHICCAPCSIYPVKILRDEGFYVMGLWYNPFIQPYTEYKKRMDAVKIYSELINLKVIYIDKYELERFLRLVTFRESRRCPICYSERLKATAAMAKKSKFDYFTTSLLYSRTQNHNLIKEIGEEYSNKYEVSFLYRDFRVGWNYGIEKSKEIGLYRQQYCGCIYSERDRYLKGREYGQNE
jgi:hypothetical protein